MIIYKLNQDCSYANASETVPDDFKGVIEGVTVAPDPMLGALQYFNHGTDRWQAGPVMPPVVPVPPAVPASVTMRQARLALLAAGKLDDVQTAIDALPEPTRSVARIEWEYSQAVERDRELVVVLGSALGLDAAALDALFIDAVRL